MRDARDRNLPRVDDVHVHDHLVNGSDLLNLSYTPCCCSTNRIAQPKTPMGIHEVKLEANGLTFSASSSWPQKRLGKSVPKQLLVLLHGFPDNKSTWDAIWPHLEAAFPKALIIAPAMRGYEPSTVLDDGAYTQDAIASDIIAFIEQLSKGAPVHLIGHDWGAIAAYKVAHSRPELLSSIVALAIPYCIVNRPVSSMWKHPIQLWLSSYMLTMQIPFLYRRRFSGAEGYSAYLRGLWEYWSPGWKFNKDELSSVFKTLQQPGVTDSATAYYRRMLQRIPTRDEFAVDFTKTPALILGGAKDGCMTIDLFKSDIENGLASQVQVVSGVGHFMQREDPASIAQIITNFIARLSA